MTQKKEFLQQKRTCIHEERVPYLFILYNDVKFFSGLSAELSYDVNEHLLFLHDVHQLLVREVGLLLLLTQLVFQVSLGVHQVLKEN